MIYQLFSIILSALFLMLMFWALWYIAVPVLVVAVLLTALGRMKAHLKTKVHKHHASGRSIHANDIIDVDFKEVR